LAKESDLWQNHQDAAEQWIVRNKDQSLRYVTGMGLTRYRPEFTAEGWQDRIQDALQTFVKEGAKQVQIDGFPWSGPPECYSENHDHDPGKGGNWYAQESKQIMRHIRQELHQIDDSVVISGEGIADFYLSYMDVQMGRDVVAEEKDRMVVIEDAEIIPLTQYAIGDHIGLRASNHVSLVDGKPWTHPRPYTRLTLGRALQWGALLLFQAPVDIPKRFESESLFEYISHIAWAFHLDGQRFLVDGQLLRPPAIESGDKIDTKAKTTIGDSKFTTVTAPAILSSAWESADGTDRAIILTNIDSSAQTTTISATDHPFTSIEQSLMYSVSNGKYKRQSELSSGESSLEVTLEPSEVRIIVATPYAERKGTALDSIIEAQNKLEDPTAAKEAVRLFVDGRYEAVTSTARELLNPDTTENSPSKNPENTTVSDTGTGGNQETTEASADVPGFGVISTVAGIISAGIYSITRGQDREDLLRW